MWEGCKIPEAFRNGYITARESNWDQEFRICPNIPAGYMPRVLEVWRDLHRSIKLLMEEPTFRSFDTFMGWGLGARAVDMAVTRGDNRFLITMLQPPQNRIAERREVHCLEFSWMDCATS